MAISSIFFVAIASPPASEVESEGSLDEINLSKLPTVLYPRDLNQLSASEEDELDN